MNRITRRWCLLAIAGAPVVLGISAQALSVRLDNDYLRISAPKLQFLDGDPLRRLRDGNTVGYLGQLTVATGVERIVQGRSVAHFAFSYDIWAERFKVTLLTPGTKARPSAKNLTIEAAQSWCLDQLKIDLAHVPTSPSVFVRLEMRSEDSKETAGIIGEPGISLSALIALFSHPVKNQQIHLVEEIGPLNFADLRKAQP
jgi:hypothetical protein